MKLWEISTEGFDIDNIPWHGNKYLIGNGYIGIRGTMEEFTKENMCGINMAGVYDRVGDKWRESVNAPNPLYTYLQVDKEKLALPASKPEKHTQRLDIKRGLHQRTTLWKTKSGLIEVCAERFASMKQQHFIGLKYSVKADYDCEIEIVTGIDGDVWDINGPHFTDVCCTEENNIKKVSAKTGEKGIVVEVSEYVTADFGCERSVQLNSLNVLETLKFSAKAGTLYTIKKVATVSCSQDQIVLENTVESITYDELLREHTDEWLRIWDTSAVEIEGDDRGMLALNYSIYHLNCIAPRNMKSMSIPARGLSGQVYKGAIFWDTEMFMIDYYIYTEPQIARTLIKYRIDTLKGAEIKAKQYSLDGAYYAWESQEGGYEACTDYNVVDVFTNRPMRTHFRDKQYHVSAAIVYAITKYINATGDYSIFSDGAMDVILKCALMYRSLLIRRADKTEYEIRDVVGPDEYHERVSNNAYTNRMAKMVFDTAVEMIDIIKSIDKSYYEKLCKSYDLDNLKLRLIDSAQNIKIKLPDAETSLIEQFDGYFALEDASVDEVRSRLLHPKEYWGGAYGVASDTQVIKQADTIAMLSIFKKDYSKEIMRKNWEYYEPRTEHGSSLSACMYSLVACYTDKCEYAYPLFLKSASADIEKGGKEWAGLIYIGGTHPAAAGGAWIVAVNGFAGIEIKDGALTCTPNLPANWKSMKFKLMFKNRLYSICIEGKNSKITDITDA